jgi:hypothetical protein
LLTLVLQVGAGAFLSGPFLRDTLGKGSLEMCKNISEAFRLSQTMGRALGVAGVIVACFAAGFILGLTIAAMQNDVGPVFEIPIE